ncbi:HEAT repeat domain-containing protein [Lysinibacillus sp. fkY74-1]|uniref:HEAT repeat domain-containing protein n=2 Tax=Lysinibacillus TaxID=400634 RepID=UPI003A4E2D1A
MEIEMARKLWLNEITEKEFIDAFFPNGIVSEYVLKLLYGAYKIRDVEAVRWMLYVASKFDLFTLNYTSVLCSLIEEDWHKSHEDIAFTLSKLKPLNAVESLYKAVFHELEYLDYDDNFALAVKCIWGLGNINSPDSIEKLKSLSKSNNETIKRNAMEQLEICGLFTERQSELILNLFKNEISKGDFIEEFYLDYLYTADEFKRSDYVLKLICDEYKKRDAQSVEYLLYVASVFGLITEEYKKIASNLIKEEWYQKQEETISLVDLAKFSLNQ